MKPTLTTRDTLRLMLFAIGSQAICLAGYTDWEGVYRQMDGAAITTPWAALHQAIEGTLWLKASHCMVVSNLPEVAGAISPHLRLDLNVEESDAHREAISLLSVHYGGHCAALLAESMPKTEEVWKQFYSLALAL